MDHKQGVLSAEGLKELVDTGVIKAALGPTQLQPASLDLTLGAKAWRVRAGFLPNAEKSMEDRLSALSLHELDLTSDTVLERGCVYIVKLRESLALPSVLSATANPKSSTGRIDVFVRLLAECNDAYERVPAGYHGPLYAEVCPRTFSILVREGSSLNQLRVRRGETTLSDADLSAVLGPDHHIAQGLNLSVDLSPELGPVAGWRARRHVGLVDVDKRDVLEPHAYFEPIAAPDDGFLILDPDEFYILASREEIHVPEDLAAEMVAIDPEIGAFRAHYAGFFDPGFGIESASRAVLEVRGFDAPFILEHGQRVARLGFEHLSARPERLYGSGHASHYQGQRLKLSKHFREL
ncbi:MAG: 2'-deoxycytidine 5'-triphosphate deaminase [Pseudomonadota bacterium]